jgi:hypothetical protein
MYMYRPSNDGIGLGNMLIKMTQVDSVSSQFLGGGIGKYIKVNIPVIEDPDGSLPSTNPPIYIGQPVHNRIRDIISPTPVMMRLIEQYQHPVSVGIQIRRCNLAKTPNFDDSGIHTIFCTDATLEKFHAIVNSSPGDVFLTTDCVEVKKTFKEKYGDKIKIVDAAPTHVHMDAKDDPWVSILEFFLLSKCPIVYMTGGNRDMFSFSTFGYMAAVYGNKQWVPVFND